MVACGLVKWLERNHTNFASAGTHDNVTPYLILSVYSITPFQFIYFSRYAFSRQRVFLVSFGVTHTCQGHSELLLLLYVAMTKRQYSNVSLYIISTSYKPFFLCI